MTPSLSGLPPIRTALIGYGFAGKTFHAPLIRAVPALCLEHVVSRDPVRVHADLPEARVSADPDEAIEAADIDLVVIASPNATHASLAERALRAGKHVVVDKPFTVTLAEARRLADLARERPGQVLSVFQNRRFDSDFLAVEAALQAGSIGPVRYFESAIERFRPQVRDRWREHDLPGSGLWFDLGPHLLDQALCLFGIPQRMHGHLDVVFLAVRPGTFAGPALPRRGEHPPTRGIEVLHRGMPDTAARPGQQQGLSLRHTPSVKACWNERDSHSLQGMTNRRGGSFAHPGERPSVSQAVPID